MTKIKFAFAMAAAACVGGLAGFGGTNFLGLLTHGNVFEGAGDSEFGLGFEVGELRGSITDFEDGLSPLDGAFELDVVDAAIQEQKNARWSCQSMGFDGGYVNADDRVECFSPTAVVYYPNDIYDELSAKGQLMTDARTIMRGHKECQALGYSGGYFENIALDSLKCGNVYEEEVVPWELYKELAAHDVFLYARFYAQEYAACLDIGMVRPLVFTVLDEAEGTLYSFCAEEEHGLSVYRGYGEADLTFVLPADNEPKMPIISKPFDKRLTYSV